MQHQHIILFDGECNLCNRSVQFIIKRDRKAVFKFASMQSEIGKRLLAQHEIPSEIDSMVYIAQQKGYIQSSAALRICRHLNGLWKIVYLLLIVPTPVRDPIYRYIARNRYKWFGKKDHCMLPTPATKDRFL